ncbi:MAG: VanZ family protein [Nonlabens sp.]|uniref:VanZ family protein n=1 Tax=Nonlabens sp. TaxID=1888209 RepID=UPI003EF883B8
MAKLFYWSAPVYTALIIYFSIGNSPAPPVDISNIDKIYHCGAYFIMAMLWYFFFYSRFLTQQSHFKFTWKDIVASWSRIIAISAAVLSFIVGVLVEFAQEYISVNRTMDMMDALANTVGIVIAIVLLWLVSKRFNTHS